MTRRAIGQSSERTLTTSEPRWRAHFFLVEGRLASKSKNRSYPCGGHAPWLAGGGFNRDTAREC